MYLPGLLLQSVMSPIDRLAPWGAGIVWQERRAHGRESPLFG